MEQSGEHSEPLPPSVAPLPYADPHTPMLLPPFPSPRTTARVMLAFSIFWGVAGIAGVSWVSIVIGDSPEPFGAYVCMLIPLTLMVLVLLGLVVETARSFRRAAAVEEAAVKINSSSR